MTNQTEAGDEPRYIVLPSGCKPSAMCSTDGTRPTLMHGYLRKRGDGLWLYATDSFAVCGLRVDGNATPGWVPRPVLDALERGDHATQLSSTSWSCASTHATVTYEVVDLVRNGTFPNVEPFLFGEVEPASLAMVALDPALTVRLAEALGARHGVVLRFSGALRVMRVEAWGLGSDERVGAQMPCR